MRKYNVYGKKNTQARPLYLLVLVFILVIPMYFVVNHFQLKTLADLKQEQVALQQEIDAFIDASYESDYHEIGSIIQYLPNSFDQTAVLHEIDLVRNASDLALATVNSQTVAVDQSSPFSQVLPETVKFVKITMSLTIDDPEAILEFVVNLNQQDRIYHISNLTCNFLEDGGALVLLTIYTFYNDVMIAIN
jgi:hypothetical protein